MSDEPPKGFTQFVRPAASGDPDRVDVHIVPDGAECCMCGDLDPDGEPTGFGGSSRSYRAGWASTFQSGSNTEGIPEC